MARKKQNLKALLISKIRQTSRYWGPKNDARKLAEVKVPHGFFKNGNARFKTMWRCGECDELFDKSDTHMDHIKPVVDVEAGFVDWNTYIDRTFVEKEDYMCLCKGCHSAKTFIENALRKEYKKK